VCAIDTVILSRSLSHTHELTHKHTYMYDRRIALVSGKLATEKASVHTQFLAEEHEDLVDGKVCVLQCVYIYTYEFVTGIYIYTYMSLCNQ